jgi:hypothetical protein
MDMKSAMLKFKTAQHVVQQEPKTRGSTPPASKPFDFDRDAAPSPSAAPSPAEDIFDEAIDTDCRVALDFLDGSRLIAWPTQIGEHSFRVQVEAGGDTAVFKSALKCLSIVRGS